jgi:putative phosphoribosyl transferase
MLIVCDAGRQLGRRLQSVRAAMTCETAVAVVPGATHLFAEPGALEQVAEVTRDWFVARLGPVGVHGRSAAGKDAR